MVVAKTKGGGGGEKAKGKRSTRDDKPTFSVVVFLPVVVFVAILAGAVALKTAKQAGRLKAADNVVAGSDGVDRVMAVLLGVATIGFTAWMAARHLVWLRGKSRDFFAAREADRAQAAIAARERIEAREARRAHKRTSRADVSSYASVADELLESMRSATTSAWDWLARRRALAPGSHVPSSLPVKPSKAPAGRPPKTGGKARSSHKREASYGSGSSGSRWTSASRVDTDDEAEAEEDQEGQEGQEEAEASDEDEGEAPIVRVPLDLSPKAEGTSIELSGLTVSETLGTAQVASLSVALQCTSCPRDVALTVALSALDERAREVRMWCEGCSSIFSASLRPALLAPGSGLGSGLLAHVDTVDCVLLDVLPASELLATCLPCGAEVTLHPLQRARRAEAACRSCHAKLALCAREIRLQRLTASTAQVAEKRKPGRATGDMSKAFDAEMRAFRADAIHAHGAPTFKTGEPLPLNGACDHFRKSTRWLRFPCCGRALPCPICHERSGCPAAELGVHANTMICGLCSREQPFSNGKCECGAQFFSAFSAHWHGGGGCRNTARLSKKDAHKHHGAHKTSSNKANRVGVKGREAAAAGQRAADA